MLVNVRVDVAVERFNDVVTCLLRLVRVIRCVLRVLSTTALTKIKITCLLQLLQRSCNKNHLVLPCLAILELYFNAASGCS